MKKRLYNLLTVKSILTLILTGVFAYVSVTGHVDSRTFITIFSVVTAFYFGTQHEKKGGETNGDNR